MDWLSKIGEEFWKLLPQLLVLILGMVMGARTQRKIDAQERGERDKMRASAERARKTRE